MLYVLGLVFVTLMVVALYEWTQKRKRKGR